MILTPISARPWKHRRRFKWIHAVNLRQMSQGERVELILQECIALADIRRRLRHEHRPTVHVVAYDAWSALH